MSFKTTTQWLEKIWREGKGKKKKVRKKNLKFKNNNLFLYAF